MKIQRCPFCDGLCSAEQIQQNAPPHYSTDLIYSPEYQVICGKCRARGPVAANIFDAQDRFRVSDSSAFHHAMSLPIDGPFLSKQPIPSPQSLSDFTPSVTQIRVERREAQQEAEGRMTKEQSETLMADAKQARRLTEYAIKTLGWYRTEKQQHQSLSEFLISYIERNRTNLSDSRDEAGKLHSQLRSLKQSQANQEAP